MARLRRFPPLPHQHPSAARLRSVRRRSWALLVALVVCCGLLASCLATADPPDHRAAPNSSAVPGDDRDPAPREALAPGGELRIGAVGSHTEWNPWHRDTLYTAMPQVLDPVTPRFFRSDDNGRLVPDPDYLVGEPVAKGTPLVVTLRLNPKAVWADGSPITWEDVRAPLRACKEPAAHCIDTASAKRVASVTRGANDHEAVVTFTGPAPDWRRVLRAPGRAELFTNPASLSRSEPDRRAQAGPFVIDAYDPATGLVTEVPNPRWWGQAPVLERISFRWFEPDALAPAFANNEVDLVPTTLNRNATARIRAVDGELRQGRSRDVRTVVFNTRAESPLRDVQVRRALARAIDREALRRADLAELEIGGTSWPPTVLGNHLLQPEDQGYRDNAGVLGPSPDTTAAAELLAKAGWKRRSDGILAKNGVRLRLDYVQVAGRSVSRDDALALAAQLRGIGVQLSIVEVPAEELATRLRSGRYDLATITVPAEISASQFHRSSGAANVTGLAVPEIDKQLTAHRTTADAGEAARIANRADIALWQEAASIPLYQVPRSVGVRKSLANIGVMGPASIDWTLVGYRT